MKENWEIRWEDYYQILGVSPQSTPDEIKKAWIDKSWILAPDRMNGAPETARKKAEEELKKVNNSYDILKDPEKRKQYDGVYYQKVNGITDVPASTETKTKTTDNKTHSSSQNNQYTQNQSQTNNDESWDSNMRDLCIPTSQDTIPQRHQKIIKSIEYVLKTTTKFGFLERVTLERILKDLHEEIPAERRVWSSIYELSRHPAWTRKFNPIDNGYYTARTNTPENKMSQKSNDQNWESTMRAHCIPTLGDTISIRQEKLINALEYVLKVTTKLGFMEKSSLETELRALYGHRQTPRTLEITIDFIQKQTAWSRIFVQVEKGYYDLK